MSQTTENLQPLAGKNNQPKKPKNKKKNPKKKGRQSPKQKIPRNELASFEDAIIKIETAASQNTPSGVRVPPNLNKSQRYVLGLVDPFNYGGRIPDEDGADSAFFLSIQNYQIPVNVGISLANPGAFSFAAQPKIGNPSDPRGFKLAVCDPIKLSQSENVTDWSAASSYLSSIGNVNPRMTNEIDTLAFNEAGYAGFTGTSAMTAAIPFGTDPVPDAGNGFTPIKYSNTTGAFTLVPGQYMVTLRIFGAGITAINTTGSTASVSTLMGLILTGTGNGASITYLVTATTSGALFIPSLNVGATSTIPEIAFVPVAMTDSTQSLNNGMIEKVRPTCMCVLVSYVGTTLHDGGLIAAAAVPGDALSSRFFAQSAADNVGSLRSFESVSGVPGAHNGPLKRGSYTFYKPLSVLDRSYYTVSDHNAYEYPSIVVTGKYNPDDSSLAGLQYPIRVSVVTGYQYQTTSQLPEKIKFKGSEAMVAAALNFLDSEDVPQSMANGDHTAFFNKIKGFVKQVSDTIGKGLAFGKNVIDKVQQYAPAARSMIETLQPMLAL